MRFMVLCTSSRAEGGTGGYEVATQRVFASLKDAESYRAGISSSRRPLTVAIVRPDDSEDVWRNEHGCEFLFLFEYESREVGTCVWLLDEDGIECGVPKESFGADEGT